MLAGGAGRHVVAVRREGADAVGRVEGEGAAGVAPREAVGLALAARVGKLRVDDGALAAARLEALLAFLKNKFNFISIHKVLPLVHYLGRTEGRSYRWRSR